MNTLYQFYTHDQGFTIIDFIILFSLVFYHALKAISLAKQGPELW